MRKGGAAGRRACWLEEGSDQPGWQEERRLVVRADTRGSKLEEPQITKLGETGISLLPTRKLGGRPTGAFHGNYGRGSSVPEG